jgi:hypothetical protein
VAWRFIVAVLDICDGAEEKSKRQSMRGILSKIPGKNLLLVLALATPLTALAQSSLVIDATNQTWKYHPNPTDPGYTPSDAWKESTFDDMSWSSGRGLFGTEAAGLSVSYQHQHSRTRRRRSSFILLSDALQLLGQPCRRVP